MGKEIIFWSSRLVASLILVATAWHFDLISELKSADTRAAAGVVAQMGATMLGFVLAALAILTSVANSRLIRNMQRTGHYRVLILRMFSCIGAFGGVALIGLALLFSPTLHPLVVYPFIGLLLVAVFVLYDVAKKFWMVLSHLHPDHAGPI